MNVFLLISTIFLKIILAAGQNYDIATCVKNSKHVTVIEQIRNAGYTAEEHVVTTEDGYILTLHRIKGPEGSKTVFLQHGLFDSSFGLILNGPKKALAYQLADNGFDVWLGNLRGNLYSRKHERLSSRGSLFWDFSWHEMGVYDLTAEINYVTSFKNDSVFYAGHSMGTTVFFVMISERPEMASKIKLMIALAPAVYLDHMKGTTVTAMPIARLPHHNINVGLFLPSHFVTSILCLCMVPQFEPFCKAFMLFSSGYNPDQINIARIASAAGHHLPAGSSLKAVMHYYQVYEAKKFIKYDYGATKNMQIYNSSTPPEYDLSNVNVPVVLFYGRNDYLTTPTDVFRLWEKLPRAELYEIEDPNFGHIDFVAANNAHLLVNPKVISLFKEFEA